MTMHLPHRGLVPVLAALALLAGACGDDDTDASASASFAEPTDGATVHGSVQLAMAANGITIEEAGEARDGAGHFHVIADAGCLSAGTAIAKDADHVHFGGGQTEGVIYLGPGTHELCLQVGDGVHSALAVTDTISITVEISSQEEWCSAMRELDNVIENADAVEDFGLAQTEFENAARLAEQLSEAAEFVDDAPEYEVDGVTASPRGHVQASLAFAADVSRAFTTAADWEEAFQSIDELYDESPYGTDANELPGGRWIEDTCDIDLEN